MNKIKLKPIPVIHRRLLKLWGIAVRKDWYNRCAICGTKENLDSHHIIPKDFKNSALKFELLNGICLCKSHHKFSRANSPHKNSLVFSDWFRTNFGGHYSWCLANADKTKVFTIEELTDIEENLKIDYPKQSR